MNRDDILAMRRNGYGLDRDGQCWTEQDRNRLNDLFHDGRGITEMARLLMRSEPAVVQMLTKEGYFRNEVKPRNRVKRSDRCICYKCPDVEYCSYSPQNRAGSDAVACPKEERENDV